MNLDLPDFSITFSLQHNWVFPNVSRPIVTKIWNLEIKEESNATILPAEIDRIDDCLVEVDQANRRIKGDACDTEFGKSEGRIGSKN